jgi:putative PIN family toxin of toxin-antitoxin system
MRVVLDSNVLVRAIVSPSGPAAAAFDLIRPPHVLIVSTAVLADLADALRYPRLRSLHGLSDAEIDAAVSAVCASAEMVELRSADSVPAISSDRDDDFILATAVNGHADVLCTLDQHLRSPQVVSHCSAHRISILSDVELLAQLR